MKRDLKEISDGKIYCRNDMVRAGCNECAGCSACCRNMGDSVKLDPYDVYRLTKGLGKTFDELLESSVELGMDEGIIIPNLKMAASEQEDGKCSFLNEEGRCDIHSIRPGFCRMFPLGRIYEAGNIGYILQVNECRKTERTKVKVEKWIDTPKISKYEAFALSWYNFREKIKTAIADMKDEQSIKTLLLYVLHIFYRKPYDTQKDFYNQFYERMSACEKIF